MIGTFRVGEDIAIALDAVTGDVADVQSIAAFIARSSHATQFRRDPAFAPIAMTVTPRPALGSIPAGWNIILPAAASADLEPGIYGIDARIVGVSGSIDITDQTAVIMLTESAAS